MSQNANSRTHSGAKSDGLERAWQESQSLGQAPRQGAAGLDEALRNLQRKSPRCSAATVRRRRGGRTARGGPAAAPSAASAAGTVALVLVAIWPHRASTRSTRPSAASSPASASTSDHRARPALAHPLADRDAADHQRRERRGRQHQTRMLTSDENLVDIASRCSTGVPIRWRSRSTCAIPKDAEEVSESAIREIVGRSRLDFVLEEGRQEITATTKELIQRTLDTYKTGIEVTRVNLRRQVPEQVHSSQRDAIKAREDRSAWPSRPRLTPTTSCQRPGLGRAPVRMRAATRRGSSPMREGEAPRFRASSQATSGRPRSRASACTSRPSKRCSATPTRCSSIPRARAT